MLHNLYLEERMYISVWKIEYIIPFHFEDK